MLNPYIAPGLSEKKRSYRLHIASQQHALPDQIIAVVCKHYGVNYSGLQAKSSYRKFVEPRQICYYLLCTMTVLTQSEIGRKFNKDHSNVIWGRDTTADRMQVDKAFAAKIELIKSELI